MIKEGNQGKMDHDFYEDLIQLQYRIYLLDAVLEKDWNVDMDALKKSWDVINEQLLYLGVAEEDLEDYGSYLKTYEVHELNIRAGKTPQDHPIEYFYYYKSCDVKMIRRLIYDRYPQLAEKVSLNDWKVFDLITEVNDDVDDVNEDTHTINGNGYLIGIIMNGKSETNDVFIDFLNDLARLNKDQKDLPYDIYHTNQENIEITKGLISTLQESEQELIKNSRIFPFLDKLD